MNTSLLRTLLGSRYKSPQLWDNRNVTLTGSATQLASGVYRILTADGTLSEVSQIGQPLVVNRWYEVSLRIDSIATLGGGVKVGANGPTFTTVGAHRSIWQADTAFANVKRAAAAATDIQISAVSFREVYGNYSI
jgi:hypothetical protein